MNNPVHRDELAIDELKLKIIVIYKKEAPIGAPLPVFGIVPNFFPAPGKINWLVKPEHPIETTCVRAFEAAVAAVQARYNLPPHRPGSTARQ
ncbi:hypothetical protein [Rhodanobacter terrae]|uniref:Uncharacterized protein n=1 Tax=Rhodanobacter terrae TaxID=418647 RepID=A0ABW0T2P7_9GAMM